jgi:hypothetical protein
VKKVRDKTKVAAAAVAPVIDTDEPKKHRRQNQILKIVRRQKKGGYAVPHTIFCRMIAQCLAAEEGEHPVQMHVRVQRDLHDLTEEWLKGVYSASFMSATIVGRRSRITGIEVDQAIMTTMSGHPSFLQLYEKFVEEESRKLDEANAAD